MYNDEGEAKINNRGGLNNCPKEFPRKLHSSITIYVFVLKL